MAVTAAVSAAVIATAGTTYSIYQGEKTHKEQVAAQRQAEEDARKAQDKIEKAEKAKALGAAAKAQRQQQAAQAGFGRRDTILTGPSGLGTDMSSPAKNTLLGG